MKKDRDCIHCEKLFDCVGKEKDKPCLHYIPRKDEVHGKSKTYSNTKYQSN